MRRAKFALLALLCIGAVSPVWAAPKKTTGKHAVAAKKAHKPTQQETLVTYLQLQASQNLIADTCQSAQIYAKELTSTEQIEGGISANNKFEFTDFDLTKGEYETTDKYNERIKNTLQVFFGEQGRVAFKLPLNDYQVSYDADRGVMKVQIYSRGSYISTHDPVKLDSTVYSAEKKVGTRRGQTAMGIKFDYELWTDYKIKVHVTTSFEGSNITDSVFIAASPETAKALRSNLILLSFGDIVYPYKESVVSEDVATLNNRYDTVSRNDDYYMSPKCLFLMNAETGEIYKSFIPFSENVSSGNIVQ